MPGGRSQTPIHHEDEMDTDTSTGQGPPNSNNDSDRTSRSSAGGTAAEFDSIIAAYHTTPSVANSAQAFIRLPSSAQLLHLYLAVQEIRSAVDTCTHPYTIPDNLKVNLKVYAKVLLAQPTVPTYEIDTLLNYMMAIVKKMRWGIPADAENTPSIWNQITKFARTVITSTRCDWKKALGRSIRSTTHVLALAKKLTARIPAFEVREPFLVRVALLRYVYANDSSESYWPSVEKQLKQLAEEQPEVRNGVLRELFVEDQRNYRDSSSGAIITSELSPSNGLQNECEVMAEAAEVMDQMADTS